MPGDGERLARTGKRRHGVVDGTAVQQRGVAVGVQGQPAADALLDKAVEVDARYAQPADGVAGLETALVADGQSPEQFFVGDAVRTRVDVGGDVLHERDALFPVGGVEPRLLHLRVGGRPEGIGEHQTTDDQEEVTGEAQPA